MGVSWLSAVLGVVFSGSVVFVASAVLSDKEDISATSTTVTRVIDGDTVVVSSGQRVRLVGVDAPESGDCGYAEATAALRRKVEGRQVLLRNPDSVKDLDKYDRLLRYIEIGKWDAGYAQIRAGRAVARYDSLDGYDHHPREEWYRSTDQKHEGACEERQRIRDERQRRDRERWRDARQLAKKANITLREGESAAHLLLRARAAINERQRLRDLATPPPPPTPPHTATPPPAPTSNVFVPPAGWTTDALTPGYTGCRQGYPGGRIDGVYVWRPIAC